MPRVPGPDARRIANPLSGLSQWKILDNLRRSLVPAALLLLLLGSWILLPDLGAIGPLLVLAIITLPGPAVDRRRTLPQAAGSARCRCTCAGLAGASARQLGQALLTFVFLPYDAFISLDAVVRTLVRLLFTRKRLLEWQTAGEAERAARSGLAGFYATMWIAPVVALACGCFLACDAARAIAAGGAHPGSLAGRPVDCLAHQPAHRAFVGPGLKPKQLAFLRRTARKTWRFFETFVTAQENWLPPDNFQEEPVPVVASRTSPTNMGLALLANLAACDFGYLPVGQLLRRTQDALATMQRLERHRGHFYNWYDTRTLEPLLPLYVSSVDSGNLAGHLLTLGPGLVELPVPTHSRAASLRRAARYCWHSPGTDRRESGAGAARGGAGAATANAQRGICLAADGLADQAARIRRRARSRSRGGIEMVEPGPGAKLPGTSGGSPVPGALAGVGA